MSLHQALQVKCEIDWRLIELMKKTASAARDPQLSQIMTELAETLELSTIGLMTAYGRTK